ncbi:MAG: glycine cleavage system protein H [Anaerolineae bacterium]|nr:glycine cleavage system protein H [Anaerolineae bacterium]MCX8068019.1 glycine cleavage system protein H [Anaerolineae bacterium]
MQIAGIEFPDDLYYDKQHNWARVEGNIVVQGMTDFGQRIAKEIVYVEIPPVGKAVTQGQTFMSMESGKWVGRIPALVSGKIVAVNEELEFEPTLINQSPFDQGWLVKIEMSNPAELNNLFRVDSPEFRAFIEEEAAKYQALLSE